MGVRWSKRDPLEQKVVRNVTDGKMYRVHLQRTQEIDLQFTVDDDEDPEVVAWELAAGGWETVDKKALSINQIDHKE